MSGRASSSHRIEWQDAGIVTFWIRYKWFLYSPAHAIPSSHASLKDGYFIFLPPAYPGCPAKTGMGAIVVLCW